MISSRVAAALSLVLAVAAVALATVAFTATLRDDTPAPGRRVQTRFSRTYEGEPAAFPLDEFYLSIDAGTARALYVYPPGYYGHARGCKVVWVEGETVVTPAGMRGPGMFVDPCGGARFDREGRLVAGPADRGLDWFTVLPAVDGYVVDTHTLYCGDAFEPEEPRPTGAPVPPAPPAPTVAASPGAPAAGAATATVALPTATPTATPTAAGTHTPTRTATPEGGARCERASNSDA